MNIFSVEFRLLLFLPDGDFVIILKLSSRRSYNTGRQRGEIISEWCLYFHHHNEMTGKKHTCGLVLFPVFPQLMFLCDILWSCCCLSSCCRLRWAAAGGRGCVVGSWLILLLFFGKPALVCVATTFARLSIWKSSGHHLPCVMKRPRSEHIQTSIAAAALQTVAFRNVP